MNSQLAVERALRHIVPMPGPEELVRWRSTLNVLIDPARLELVDQVASADDPQERELIRKTFGPVASNADGLASLAAFLTAEEPLVLKHFESAYITIGTNKRRLTLLPDESAVREDRMPGFPFGTLIGSNLLVWVNNAPFVGDVTIRGTYMATLANQKPELDERYVMILHSLGAKQIPSNARTQARELKSVAAEGK